MLNKVKIVGGILTIIWYTGSTDDFDVNVWGQNLLQLGFYPLSIATLAFIRKWYLFSYVNAGFVPGNLQTPRSLDGSSEYVQSILFY